MKCWIMTPLGTLTVRPVTVQGANRPLMSTDGRGPRAAPGRLATPGQQRKGSNTPAERVSSGIRQLTASDPARGCCVPELVSRRNRSPYLSMFWMCDPLPPQASDAAAESPGGACGRQYLDAYRSSLGAGGLLGGAPAATEQPQRQLLGAIHPAADLRDEGRHRSSSVVPTGGSDVLPAGGMAPVLGPHDVGESPPRARRASRRQLPGLLRNMRATPAGAVAGSSTTASDTGFGSLASQTINAAPSVAPAPVARAPVTSALSGPALQGEAAASGSATAGAPAGGLGPAGASVLSVPDVRTVG